MRSNYYYKFILSYYLELNIRGERLGLTHATCQWRGQESGRSEGKKQKLRGIL